MYFFMISNIFSSGSASHNGVVKGYAGASYQLGPFGDF